MRETIEKHNPLKGATKIKIKPQSIDITEETMSQLEVIHNGGTSRGI